MLSATLQYIGILTSWTSLAWSFVSFATALRNSNPGKAKMRISSKVTMFLWRFFTIGARMIALALFASAFGFWATLALMGGHLVVMIVWMLQQNSIYCRIEVKDEEGNVKVEEHPYKEHFFRALVAFILVFSFFNISEGRTRLRSLVYYTVIFVENMAMIIAWYITASTKTYDWYHTPAIIMVILGFFIGIMFQLLYYKFCHPIYYSKEHELMTIPFWVSCNELSLVGPHSKEAPSGAFQEVQLLSKEGRKPIYNPPSKTGSVTDKSSMAGVYRSTDDTIDLSDSLIYQPNDAKRSEVPQVGKADENTGNEEESNCRRIPPRVKASGRNKPQPRSPAKSLPIVQEMSPQNNASSSYLPREAQPQGHRRVPRMSRGTPPSPISSPEHSSPACSPASTPRGLESNHRSEENVCVSETSQDTSCKSTTV